MIGLGEVLWDILPTGKVLGGAPTNFAYMTTVLGDQGIVASRVGNDDLGRKAYQVMRELGLSTSYVQFDDQHETGIATVTMTRVGNRRSQSRNLLRGIFCNGHQAWEELSSRADVVCFGSLAQRSALSAATIECFLRNIPAKTLRICDANLRQRFYDTDTLRRSFQHADIVKVNDRELLEISLLLQNRCWK